MLLRTVLTIVCSLVIVGSLSAQGTRADYERANALGKQYRGKIKRFRPRLRWAPKDRAAWWKARGDGETGYWRIDTRTGKRTRVAKREQLKPAPKAGDETLTPLATWGPSKDLSDERTTIKFVNRLEKRVRLFWSDRRGRTKAHGTLAPGKSRVITTWPGHVFLADFKRNDLCGIFVATEAKGIAIIDRASRKKASPNAPTETKRPYRVMAQSHNIVVDANGTMTPLTTDGTATDRYERPRWLSPDGKKALGFRVRPAAPRKIPLVASSPKDQVQPKLTWLNYRKPGDTLDARRPRLFDLARRTMIDVPDTPFADAYAINRVHWSADSKRVYCVHNQRGHQQLTLFAIDAKSGKVSTIVQETSKTFVDYSQKTYLHWLPNGDFLWASERDGWNHLYRFRKNGTLINRVTRGRWVVRKVEKVDGNHVYFTAMGIHPDQDPYHRHLVRVDLDGKNLTVLTQGDGTHQWTFSPTGSFFVDTWSRVDHPRVTEIRRTKDGSLVAELGRDDHAPLLAAGFRPAERFVAKGRDGKTDIHGLILRPSTFREGERYPVIEAIYAGPHGHHVPKAFTLSLRNRALAELGFIVVQIDGMGTNWRSKAFHDVCWRNLKDGGFPDRIRWMRAAAAAHPELDLERVGIFGGSAGGQNALAAMLHHGDFYDAAAADCGCHDNRMDKIWWNEAWMGAMGPHYADNSNVTHAHKLTGKLFLTVGELDRNVDPASTMQVVDALIKANKDFELIVVPGAGHGVGERPYLARRRQDFFVRALYGVEPRRN